MSDIREATPILAQIGLNSSPTRTPNPKFVIRDGEVKMANESNIKGENSTEPGSLIVAL